MNYKLEKLYFFIRKRLYKKGMKKLTENNVLQQCIDV